MTKPIITASILLALAAISLPAAERTSFDNGWKFTFGNASDPAKDFGCGTEYFNYLTKAASIHNEGPYSAKFDPTEWDAEWIEVTLPHDWVVDLPFEKQASHSHGYKTVGYKYPETSVGWYRKIFTIPAEDLGKHISLQFDGIFRDARVWVNGFYLGSEPSGYATQVYDISEYLNYGGENVIAVRADATLEEGWFYEGGGIYRHAWLDKTDPLHVAPFGVFAYSEFDDPQGPATVTVETTVDNKSLDTATYELRNTLIGPDGSRTVFASVSESSLPAKSSRTSKVSATVGKPVLWDIDNPAMYSLETEVVKDGVTIDKRVTTTGIRRIRLDPDSGFFLNGRHIKLKGVNLHQDHAGTGAAIPDALHAFRLRELKKYGVNAVRTSHNPVAPAMLDACDSLGILVLEENRLTGINDEHIRLLRKMIERDRNHPSIFAWSVGNEEWGTEWNDFGRRISASMNEYCHHFDPTRPATVATSGGPTVVETVDVAGYNYVLQNPIDEHRRNYPKRIALGSEETTGCGARGVYYDDHANGYMQAINRTKSGPDSLYNAIERGWKFYDERPWLAGLFYWTGIDYRGEPNPMVYPATGSQFGILDYCALPKDEAFYIKSWWTDEAVLHIFPHWNLKGHEGEPIELWAYSNMDEVELFVNGKSLGRKAMPRNGHLSWNALYKPGEVKAIGYKNGKKTMETRIETTGEPARIALVADRKTINADGEDISVVTVSVLDSKNRLVPDACIDIELSTDGTATILGTGNGDPVYLMPERPAKAGSKTFSTRTFNGYARVILQSDGRPGTATLTVASPSTAPQSIEIRTAAD